MTPKMDSNNSASPHNQPVQTGNMLQKLMLATVEQLSSAVLIFDGNGLIVYANRAFLSRTGQTLSDLSQTHRRELNNFDEKIAAAVDSIDDDNPVWSTELLNQDKNGRHFRERRTVTRLQQENSLASHYIELSEELAEAGSSSLSQPEASRFANRFDSATGLPNRRTATSLLNQAIATARKKNKHVLAVLLGLDNFKPLCDALGPEMGDLLLKDAASRIASSADHSLTVAHLDRNEFLLISPDIEQPFASGQQLNQTLSKKFSEAFQVQNQDYFLSASLGIASYPQDGHTASTLIHNAGTAMRAAVHHGSPNCRFFEPEMTTASKERLALEQQLRRAVTENQLSLHFQPKLDCHSQTLVGAEALLRWKDNNGNDIAPDTFIPIAEELGLIVPIGEWVLQESCRQLHGWIKQMPNIHLAINVSANQLRSSDFVGLVRQVLRDAGLPPSSLVVEITENVVLEDTDQINGSLRELTDLGVRLSIDDFGTGYSSFSYLKRFKFHELKIDRSFIKDIEHDSETASVTKGLISMAHSLGLSTVGEGAENVAQYQQLKNLSCDLLQGYYYHRPMNAEKFEELLAA